MSDTHISKISYERVESQAGAVHGGSRVTKARIDLPGLETTPTQTDIDLVSEKAQKHATLVKTLVEESEIRQDVIEKALQKLKDNPRWPAQEAIDAFAEEQRREVARSLLSPLAE